MSRKFDDLGPAACVSETMQDLQRNNPELLRMASEWVGGLDDPDRVMTAFSMFYRLLTAELPETRGGSGLSPLPRVSDDARVRIMKRIDVEGADRFFFKAIEEMELSNPQLLQMAHYFASDRGDYAHVMRGFALLYAALQVQSGIDRESAH